MSSQLEAAFSRWGVPDPDDPRYRLVLRYEVEALKS
jgi:hypothetical protein